MIAHPSARRFVRTLWQSVPARSWLLVLLMVLGVLTEGLGILLLVPLLQLVGLDLGGGTLGRIGEGMEAAFRAVGLPPTLPAVLLVFVLLVSGRALVQLKEAMARARLEQEFVYRLRTRLFRAATYSDWRFFSKRRGSDVIHALVDDLHRVSVATTQVLRLVAQLLVGTVYLVIAAGVSPLMTAVAAICGAALLLVLRGWNERARAAGARVSQDTSAIYAAIHEHVAAMKTAKSYGAEASSIRLFSSLADRVARSYVNVTRQQAAFTAIFAIGAVLILSLIVYGSIALLGVSAAGILLLLFLFARLVPRFSTVQTSYHIFMNVVPAFDRVMDLTEACEAAAEPSAGVSAADPVPLRDRVELRDVRFGYDPKSERPVLDGVDLVVPARQTTALVGPSGAGKSTIADVVMGLLRPDAGSILIDDTPLGSAGLQAWRRQVGYVPQDPFLFHDTVRANLLWGSPDASEEECWEALRMAAAADFVSRLSGGLDAVVGDRGILVSGGERQRLVLARALLRHPALLVLDEATSALDARSELDVQAAIRGLRGRTTVLVISHRLSTVRDADVIHVIDRGRVAESGTWEELAGRPEGAFRELCRLQGLLDPWAAGSP